jgi:hypothetical protein
MAKGHPDYLGTIQDPTGKTGAKVDAGGFLAVGAIDGSGFIGSVGVIGTGSAAIDSDTDGSGTWTNVDTAKNGKYMFLQCSWDDNSAVQRVRLENLTTSDVLCDEWFICSCQFSLNGFIALGTDTIKITLYNYADATKTVNFNVHWVEIEPD